MGVDPVAVGVTLLAEGVLGVLYADTAAVRCGQDSTLHSTAPWIPNTCGQAAIDHSIHSNTANTRILCWFGSSGIVLSRMTYGVLKI